jgi:hypothetical protein
MGKTAIEYLEQRGVPWRRSEEGQLPPTWDGVVLTLPWTEKGDAHPEHVAWVFHEISHHILAPQESVKLPNYGLGTDPGGGGHSDEVAGASRGRDSDEDESAVCILDLIRMVEEGLNPSFIRSHSGTYNIHNLGERDYELLAEVGYSRDRVSQAIPYLEGAEFAVQAAAHGGGCRYDGDDPEEPGFAQMRTYEEAVGEAQRWISHADTVGGQARVVHVSTGMVVWP